MKITIYMIRKLDGVSDNFLDGKIYNTYDLAKQAIQKNIEKRVLPFDKEKQQNNIIDYGYGIAVLPKKIKDKMDLVFGMNSASSEIHAITLDSESTEPAEEFLPYAHIKLSGEQLIETPRIIIPLEIERYSDKTITENQILNDFGKLDVAFRIEMRIEDNMLTKHAIAVNNINDQPTVTFALDSKDLKQNSKQEIIDEYAGQFSDGYFEKGIYNDDYSINFDYNRPIIVKNKGEK